MNILDSAWLLKMLKKSGRSPQERLLAIFDVVSDWLDAPLVRETLLHELPFTQTPSHLLDYLTSEAHACGAQMPEALAQQIYFIVLSAIQENLRSPDNQHLLHAKLAAKALIAAQTEKEPTPKKTFIYGMAASLLIGCIVGGLMLYQTKLTNSSPVGGITESIADTLRADKEDGVPSPKLAADMYAQVEQMRQGDCRYVEALQIPDADKKVYIENVVGGKVPSNAKDLVLAQSYLRKINCSYTPMLMRNSTN